MPSWSTACPDWRARLLARQSLVPFAPLYLAEAEAALAVFKSLQVTDQEQKLDGTWPTLGELCDEWVFDFVRAIFGAYDPVTKRRLIRDFMLLISKKNAKSTIAAGIMLTALIRNPRPKAELLILAPTIEVAGNSFGPAKGMIDADPQLQALFHVIENRRLIRHRITKAELKIVAADSAVVSGKKASFVLVEELWMFGKRPDAEAMLREATGGLVSRPEGFVIYITTHSDEPPAGVYKAKLEYFREVRDGLVDDPGSMGLLYEWPEDMIERQDYLRPEFWHVTNPNLGRSVSAEWLLAELKKEQRGDGAGLQQFLAKHLNVEIGLRLRRDRWKGAEWWEARGSDALAGLANFLAACDVVVGGVDGGGNDDLYGLALLGRCKVTGHWLCWSRAWVHGAALEERKEIAPALRDFAADGDLVIWGEHAGDDADVGIGDEDIEQVADILAEARDSGLMPEKYAVGMDAAGLGTLLFALKQRGFTDEQISSVGQGFRLTGAIQAVERRLRAGTLRHGGSRMMNWCVGNARALQKGNAVIIDKQTAGKAKIDPVIALFNAARMMEREPVAAGNGGSPWDDPAFSIAASLGIGNIAA